MEALARIILRLLHRRMLLYSSLSFIFLSSFGILALQKLSWTLFMTSFGRISSVCVNL